METVTVKQIHEAFDGASDTLYLNAVKKHAVDHFGIEKSERLKRLGFARSSECVGPFKKDELPIYYRGKYPFLKFITHEQLEVICEKYGLIYAEAGRYIGGVPEKNLREIECAQPLADGDKFDGGHLITGKEWELRKKELFKDDDNYSVDAVRAILDIDLRFSHRREIERYANTLFVAANRGMFNLKGMENVKGAHEYRVKDPIVFRWCRGGRTDNNQVGRRGERSGAYRTGIN
jgi:hypothetical protein